MTWEQLLTFVQSGRKTVKRLRGKGTNNTWVEGGLGDSGQFKNIRIRLYGTIIVSIDLETKTYRLNSGGWRTVTTKDRINSFSPAHLYQKDRVWYLRTSKGDVEFRDEITVDERGDVVE